MDHLLKALDEHIAHQDWLLRCEKNAKEELEKEVDKLKAENHRLNQRLKDDEAREQAFCERAITPEGTEPQDGRT